MFNVYVVRSCGVVVFGLFYRLCDLFCCDGDAYSGEFGYFLVRGSICSASVVSSVVCEQFVEHFSFLFVCDGYLSFAERYCVVCGLGWFFVG